MRVDIHAWPFFASSLRRTGAWVPANAKLLYSLDFSISLMHSCLVVHADDIANIWHAALVGLCVATIYNFVLAVMWLEMLLIS